MTREEFEHQVAQVYRRGVPWHDAEDAVADAWLAAHVKGRTDGAYLGGCIKLMVAHVWRDRAHDAELARRCEPPTELHGLERYLAPEGESYLTETVRRRKDRERKRVSQGYSGARVHRRVQHVAVP